MAKTTPTSTFLMENPGIVLVISYFIVMVVNAVVIYFANSLMPQQVVLGTYSISHTWAIILSSGALALLTTFLMPFISMYETKMKRLWTPPELMAMYLLINFVAIWLVTRFSEIFGLGVSSWFVVLILAVIMDLLQGMVFMGFEKIRTGK
jgi:uncharacterized membrane protein YvlD (DUF360 family)